MAKKANIDAVRPTIEVMEKTVDKIEGALDAIDAITDKGTNVVEAGLEKVADVVPDALDTGVHVSTKGARRLVHFFSDPKHAALSVVVFSTTVGAGLGVAGYFAMKRRLETKLRKEYDEQFDAEVEEMREHYSRLTKSGRFDSPEAAVEELLTKEAATALRHYGNQTVELKGEPVVDVRAGEVTDAVGAEDPDFEERAEVNVAELRERMRRGPVTVEERTDGNIFLDGHPLTGEEEWDQAEIDRARSSGEPHVISHDEFMENPDDWSTNNLTYFNGDDTLVDDQEVPIDDIEEVVGSENLSKFGQGSRDRNVVYVRNPKSEVLFEITFHAGEYSKEVAGFKHSSPIGLRRFRDSDD